LLIGNDTKLLKSVKEYLNSKFSMKDLGEAAYILGIKIYRDRSRCFIGLSQNTYHDKTLKKFRMDGSKKGFLPMLPGNTVSKTQSPTTAYTWACRHAGPGRARPAKTLTQKTAA
jgi:hypothetical protein